MGGPRMLTELRGEFAADKYAMSPDRVIEPSEPPACFSVAESSGG